MFKQARAQRERVVATDGGDFVPGLEDTLTTERAELMLAAMELMDYSAVAVGENELILGPEFLAAAAQRIPLVSANLRLSAPFDAAVPRVRWQEFEGLRVAVTAYVDPLLYYTWPGAVERGFDDMMVLDPHEALTELLPELEGADAVVLLAHADRAHIEDLLPRLSGIDVVVQGHEPHGLNRVEQISGAHLVEPGRLSRQVAQTDFAWTDGLQVETHRLWTLRRFKRGDARVDKLVDAFEQRHGKMK